MKGYIKAEIEPDGHSVMVESSAVGFKSLLHLTNSVLRAVQKVSPLRDDTEGFLNLVSASYCAFMVGDRAEVYLNGPWT